MKECVICKNEFKERDNRQQCCSKECSKINKIQKQKVYNKKDTSKQYYKDYRVKHNKEIVEYHQTDKYKQYKKQYYLSPKFLAWQEKYESKEERIQKKKDYQKSEQRLAYWRNFRKTEQYKLWTRTSVARMIRLRAHLNRQAREKNIIIAFTRKEFIDKVNKCNGLCPKCGKSFNDKIRDSWLTLDHIYSVFNADNDFKKTGIKRIYTINDVQPLCLSCNCKKNKYHEPKDLNTEVILTN
jgi:hypothetical protein